jgi:hypothetical protein
MKDFHVYNSHFAPQPVHASGRYFRNSLVEILKDDFGYKKVYSMCPRENPLLPDLFYWQPSTVWID